MVVKMIRKIGVTDTTFARGDMGGLAMRTLAQEAKKRGWSVELRNGSRHAVWAESATAALP